MEEQVTSARACLVVFIALLALLAATVLATNIEHAAVGLTVALSITFIKAALIAVYFMNLRFSTTTTRLAALAGLFALTILLVLTLSDYWTRERAPLRGQPRTHAAPGHHGSYL